MPSLVDLADHPAIIFPAYFAALVPLALLPDYDVITKKWETVGEIRSAGRTYLFLHVPPLCLVVFYIHLQRLQEDYKEMAAATSAAVLCIYFMWRTWWGLVQLDAFKIWNMRALRCLNRMGYETPVYETGNYLERDACIRTPGTWFTRVKNLGLSACTNLVSIFKREDRDNEEPSEMKTNLNEAERGMTIDKHMMVNSSLVDNEYGGAELPCRLKTVCALKGIWELVTRGTAFHLSDYLECEMPLQCSLRWLVVFVARFGSQWLTEKSNLGSLEKYDDLPFDEKKKAFRRRVGALAVMKTTFKDGEELISERCPTSPFLETPSTQWGLRLTESERAELPYKCSGYEDYGDISFENLSSSVREVILGWDRRALSKLGTHERKSVEQMSPSQISCFAKMMSSNLVESHPLTSDRRAVSIAQQIRNSHSEEEEEEKFDSFVPTNTSSHRQNLWTGRFANKLVDQACVHIDNWTALESGRRLKRITSPEDISNSLRESGTGTFQEQKTLEMRAYEHELSQDETVETRASWGIIFVGCVMEAVRAFLAHSVAGLSNSDIENINWRPTMDKNIFKIQCSRQLLNCLLESQNDDGEAGTNGEEGPQAWNVESRLLWELQLSFHSVVSKQAEEDGVSGGLVKSSELMALCMLGFPCLEVTKGRRTVNDESTTPTEGQQTVYRSESDTVLGIGDDGCDTERAFFKVKPVEGPQPMWLNVSVDCKTGSGKVEVVAGDSETTSNVFEWQAWKDSFMGRVQGQAAWREKMVGPEELRLHEEALKSILSTPIMNLPEDVKQWGGWPPLYSKISMISPQGTFGADGNDYEDVEEAMDEVERKRVLKAKKDGVTISGSGGTSEAVRAIAQISIQEGHYSKSLGIYCKHIEAHNDPGSLDAMLELLGEHGKEFVLKHMSLIQRCMYYVLQSTIELSRKRSAGREGAESATIRLDELADSFSFLREMCPEYEHFPEGQIRCLFELRDPKLLPILQNYRAEMYFSHDSALQAAVFCFDQWKSSGEPHMRLLGEAYLETSGQKNPLEIGYLFEKGIMRGRQTARLKDLRWQNLEPDLSVQETACHFVAHSPDSDHVVRKSTATAVRIYQRYIYTDGPGEEQVMNRLGLVYLLSSGGLQDLDKSDFFLFWAKWRGSKDAKCNLAVLYGLHHKDWDYAGQILMKEIHDTDLVVDSDTPLSSYGFQRPSPESVSINENVYKIWDKSDICDDPHTSSMNNLAVMYEMEDSSLGDVRQALGLYERILVIDENPVALFNMIVLLKLGPAAVRDETRSESLLQTLQSRLIDNEHMPVLAKSIIQLGGLRSSGEQQKWSVGVDELENCAVFVKQFDEQP